MERAIESKTKTIVFWDQVLNEKYPEYMIPDQITFLADPELIDAATVPANININEIPVIFRKRHLKYNSVSNTTFDVRGAFCFKNNDLGICEKGESDFHKYLKQIASKIRFQRYVSIKAGNALETSYEDVPINTVRSEAVMSNELMDIRGDVTVFFTTPHQVFGTGLIIEIQLSKQDDPTKQHRTIQRNTFGFSVCWIERDHADEIVKDDANEVESKFIVYTPAQGMIALDKSLGERLQSAAYQILLLESRTKEVTRILENAEDVNADAMKLLDKVETLVDNQVYGEIRGKVEDSIKKYFEKANISGIINYEMYERIPDGLLINNVNLLICPHCNNISEHFELRHSKYEDKRLKYVCPICKKWNSATELKNTLKQVPQ